MNVLEIGHCHRIDLGAGLPEFELDRAIREVLGNFMCGVGAQMTSEYKDVLAQHTPKSPQYSIRFSIQATITSEFSERCRITVEKGLAQCLLIQTS